MGTVSHVVSRGVAPPRHAFCGRGMPWQCPERKSLLECVSRVLSPSANLGACSAVAFPRGLRVQQVAAQLSNLPLLRAIELRAADSGTTHASL